MQSEESTRPSEAAPNGREGAAQKAKPAVETVQMPGTTAFPISKVSKIIKADRDVHMCQKEAVFLISCATVSLSRRSCLQKRVLECAIPALGILFEENNRRCIHPGSY